MKQSASPLAVFPYAPTGPGALEFWHWAIHNADPDIDACPEAGRLGQAFLEHIGVKAPISNVTTIPGKWLRPGLVFVDVWVEIDESVELLLHRPGHVRPGEKLEAYAKSRPSGLGTMTVELQPGFVPQIDTDEHFPEVLAEPKLLELFDAGHYSHPVIRAYEQRIRNVLRARTEAFEAATSDDREARRAALRTVEGQWAYMAGALAGIDESPAERMLPWGMQRALPAVQYDILTPAQREEDVIYQIEDGRSGPTLSLLHRARPNRAAREAPMDSRRVRELWSRACKDAGVDRLNFAYGEMDAEWSTEGRRIWSLAVAEYHCDVVSADLAAVHGRFVGLLREEGW